MSARNRNSTNHQGTSTAGDVGDGRVRVPADIDRPDQLIAGLTARQAALLTACACQLWLGWQATGAFVPPLVFLGAGVPVMALAVLVALGRRDGLPLDRYLLAAWAHARTPRRQVHAPEGVPPVPEFVDAVLSDALTFDTTSGGPDALPRRGRRGPRIGSRRGSHGIPARYAPPASTASTGLSVLSGRPAAAAAVAQGIDAAGVVDLGRDGTSLLAAVGTVNFQLRTPAEQQALIRAFGAWLNSLPGPVQILVRADQADLTPLINALRDNAPALAHPALEQAARRHAGFLADLGATRDLLHRQVLLTHHDPHPVAATQRGGSTPGPRLLARLTGLTGLTGTSPRTQNQPDRPSEGRRVAVTGGRALARRAEDGARMLAGADVSTRTLDGATASALLSAACHPQTAGQPTHLAAPPHLGSAGPDAGSLAGARVAISGDSTEGLSAGLTPQSLQLGVSCLAVGGEHVASFAVTGYPAEVGPGWLEPLLTYPGRLDVALHIEPVSPVVAAERLRKQRARLESTRRLTDHRGRLQDPELEAAADDATDLAYAIARGQTRLFKVGIYLTVHAPSADELGDAVSRVRALAESLLLRIEPATWRTVQGWVTTLPLGIDALKLRRTLDTDAIASAFPFTSSDLPAIDPVRPGRLSGILYGVNATSPGLVVWDRWAQDNYNSVILARSGSGKSYLTKLDVLRSLYDGVHVAVIDPEHEYTRLAQAMGGTVLALGQPGVRLNPLDLPAIHPDAATAADQSPGGPGSRGGPDRDGLTRRLLFAHTFLDVALAGGSGGLDAAEHAILDHALMGAYRGVGITADPRTWVRPAPLLGDVADALARLQEQGMDGAGDLAARLAPYVSGSYSGLFNGPTTVRPDGHLVAFSLRELPEELKTLATLLTLDAIWQQVSDPYIPATARRRRLVVVDEAWLLMRDPAGAAFLYRLAKAARKHGTGLSVITQDAADLLSTDLGRAVVANASTQILMRQSPQAIDDVADAFALSAGERQILLAAPCGDGLLVAGGSHRVAFHAVADPHEGDLCSSTPAVLTHPARTVHAGFPDLSDPGLHEGRSESQGDGEDFDHPYALPEDTR